VQKIVINGCHGGFSLSEKAEKYYNKLKGIKETHIDYDDEILRNDPILIKVVEELGNEANGSCANLHIVEIPDDVQWIIKEYDGAEWIAEEHKTWS